MDGKQDSPLASLLQRNTTLNPVDDMESLSDIALIRSVYRTATVKHNQS
jgi:hypothetical protein